MNSKERMLSAITTGLKKNFPVVIPYTRIFLRDHWDQITDQPWWTLYFGDVFDRVKVGEDLQAKLGLDWVECRMCRSREWRETHKVITQGSRVFLIDEENGRMEELFRPPVGGFHRAWVEMENPIIESLSDVDERVHVTDGDSLIRDGRLDFAKTVVKRFGSEKFVYASVGSPYWVSFHYFGFKGMLINLFKKPNLVKYLNERVMTRTLEEIKAYAKVGVDGIWIEECLSSADVISLTQFKEFALPYVEALISEIKRLRMKSICYLCGDVRDRLEYVVEAEPDCISLEESKKGFNLDIEWINEVVSGKTCIFGNLDAINILQNGTSRELELEIKRQLQVGREYGKFIMSLGSPVTPDTPLRRVKEYVEITRRYADSDYST